MALAAILLLHCSAVLAADGSLPEPTPPSRDARLMLKATKRLQARGLVPLGVRPDLLERTAKPGMPAKGILEYMGALQPRPNDLVRFLHQFGAEFKIPAKPPAIELDGWETCFQNAERRAIEHGDTLGYAEGYVALPFLDTPVSHAWNYDLKTGEVIDPTLGWNPKATYFGVRIPKDKLVAYLKTQKLYGPALAICPQGTSVFFERCTPSRLVQDWFPRRAPLGF